MNKGFFSGKIVSDVDFNFIYDSKRISIAIFEILVENNQIVKIKSYDEFADFSYSMLEKGMEVFLYGKLTEKLEVELEYIYIV